MGTKKRTRWTRVLLWGLLALGLAVLAVTAAVTIPILTHTSAGDSGQADPDGFVTYIEATGADGNTRTLEILPVSGTVDPSSMTPGEQVIVRGSGYDSAIGIYVSFCKIPAAGERPGPCLGGIPEGAMEGDAADAERLESAWVTNNWAWRAFSSHQYLDAAEGTFEVQLHVPEPITDDLDCRESRCAIFTRADHTAGGDRVQDLFIPVGFEQE